MSSGTPVFDQRRKLPHARKRMKLLRYALLFVHNFYLTVYKNVDANANKYSKHIH